MSMFVDELIKQPGLWSSDDLEAGIVVSSRVRLARNLKGAAFPGWAKDDERLRLCGAIRKACDGLPGLRRSTFLDMGELEPVDKDVLIERHLISRELAAMGAGSGVVLRREDNVAIMVNEEDHLRMQVIRPGMSLRALWEAIDALDSELSASLDFAFSPRLGYLTACPSNVGTGLRVSVMLHLTGLRLLNEIDPVVKGLDKIGLTVRGVMGEGSDAEGNIFQVSNQATLGESESDIVDLLGKVGAELVQHERNARARLLEDRRSFVQDYVGRALGILSYARLLSSGEVTDLVAALRFGVELGMVRKIAPSELNEIMLLTQPGHLQKLYDRVINPDERDEMRAQLVKKRIASCELVD
jgi:protein arginine kinase